MTSRPPISHRLIDDDPKPSRVRKSTMGKWRALVLIGVHVLIALHLAHWLTTGATLTPVEPSEAMAFSRDSIVNAGFETVTNGASPWTLRNKADYSQLRTVDSYESPDRAWVERTLPPRDRLQGVYYASTAHEEDQPIHLQVADTSICIGKCAEEYQNPCTRFCPAGVYEVVTADNGQPRFQINAQNCVHCKTCDIKDPAQNIDWSVPEGGGGPNYPNM